MSNATTTAVAKAIQSFMGRPSLISIILDDVDSPPGEGAVKIAFVEPKMRLLEEQRLANHCTRLDFGIVSFSDLAPGKDGAMARGKLLIPHPSLPLTLPSPPMVERVSKRYR